jgi:hypothetical protein
MHALLALFAAAAMQAAPADAHASKDTTVKCHWEAAQSNGIPTKVCMTAHERKMRTSYTQQQIRESQARSYTHN